MTADELMTQAESHIDDAWSKAMVSLEADMREQGFTDDGISAMLEIRRQEWAECKAKQLAEIGEFLRGRLQ